MDRSQNTPGTPATATGITFEAAADLLGAMISIPSINPTFRHTGQSPGLPEHWFGEARLAAFVCNWLTAAGIDAHLDEALPGRPNVVARLGGPEGGKRMIWEGHLDTVQVDGMDDPFTPRLEGRRLYGRGAVDDKGCLAMFMLAMRAAHETKAGCDLTFVAAIDEEVTFEGVQHHIRTHGTYDFGIAGEPTGLAVVRACKGVIRWVIEVRGIGAHASKPEEGVDAIAVAAELLAHLRTHIAETVTEHPLLGHRTLTCTLMHAGEGANSLSSRAHLTFDFRTLPEQTGAQAWAEIDRVVQAFGAARTDGATFVMHQAFIDSVSMEVDEDSEIVMNLSQVLRQAGLPHAAIGVPFGSDASKLTRAGTPTVIFGPGRIEEAHAVEEYVDVDEVVRGAELLVSLARVL